MRLGSQLAGGLIISSLALATMAETTPAVWKETEFKFSYHGFTTNYSCAGLKSKVRKILIALGARPNPQIHATGCEIFGGVAISPRLHVRAAFPVAVPEGDVDASAFAAQTEVVTLSSRRPGDLEMGDCELVEQLRHSVFPGIGSRVLADKTACVPHQANLGRPYMQLEVLRSVAAGDVGSTPR